jgi:hypothetical protein
MDKSSISSAAEKALDPHLELTQAHREAARLAAVMCKALAQIFQIDVSNTQRQAITLGSALERVARSERACGACAGQDHVFAKAYQEMLQQQRLAYLDFERLARELGDNLPPRCCDIAALAADIECHLGKAEGSHQASIASASLKKSG